MLRHQFGQNLVLGLDLLLQVCDPLLVGGLVGRPPLIESSRPVFEELLLPAVEDRRLQANLIAQFRDRLLVQQMPPQDGDFLFRRVVLPCVRSVILTAECLPHFQLNRNSWLSRPFVPVAIGAVKHWDTVWAVLCQNSIHLNTPSSHGVREGDSTVPDKIATWA